MDEKQAKLIALEFFYAAVKNRKDDPETYERIAERLDLDDDTIDEAFAALFPDEKLPQL